MVPVLHLAAMNTMEISEFSSGIKAEATDSALYEVVKELRSYSSDGITDEELSVMKSAIGQRDALRYETGIQKSGLYPHYFGLPIYRPIIRRYSRRYLRA